MRSDPLLMTNTQISKALFPHSFAKARKQVLAERDLVEHFLTENPEVDVYGFSTLLGHLDYQKSSSTAQKQLLTAHLIGPATTFSKAWGQLLTRVKIAQISAGSSGMHLETFDVLLSVAERLKKEGHSQGGWKGNWLASYGSGDVVPGAWFASCLEKEHLLELSHPGDLISLINGNFVSTAAAITVHFKLMSLVEAALHSLSVIRPIASNTQLPVTLRDISPVERSSQIAMMNLAQAISHRLANPSGNPLFDCSSDSVIPLSQSSFLDFTLTGALSSALHVVSQVGVYLKAALKAKIAEGPLNEHTPIQPVKIIEFHLREIASQVLPPNFGFEESEGTEDIGDLSLMAATKLAKALHSLDTIIEIFHRTIDLQRSEELILGVSGDLLALCEASYRDLLSCP